jgi:signal transduction histidine kinase
LRLLSNSDPKAQGAVIPALLPSEDAEDGATHDAVDPLKASQTNASHQADADPDELNRDFSNTGSPGLVEAADLSSQRQIVVPLIYDDVMMGLLVTARSDRAWSEPEQSQIQSIAQTIAIACVLDQRSQWLDHELLQQRLMQAQQHDLFHDLLHQLRNPLTALRTFGKLLLKRLNPEDQSRGIAEGIVRESDRLQDLLKQFDAAVSWGEARLLPSNSHSSRSFRLSQELAGELTGSPNAEFIPIPHHQGEAPDTVSNANYERLLGSSLDIGIYSLAEALEPLVMSANAIAQERQLNLQAYIPADSPPVRTDIRALQEVLNNLIDNALKYTPAGGTVEIWAGLRQNQRQAIVIADTGPGIPAADVEHIFERHYRGIQGITDIPGSGLGLAIAHRLIHQMQGEIQVFSPARSSDLIVELDDHWGTEEYPGTAFIVWLPEERLEGGERTAED